jgi:prepilin-type N-terminal cleavage/methylation domain-containing protein
MAPVSFRLVTWLLDLPRKPPPVPSRHPSPTTHHRAFTLIELLVVILIIGAVSVIVIPTIVVALGERSVHEAARLVQAQFAAAQAVAARNNAPAGIRCTPDPAMVSILATGGFDPTKALVLNKIVPLEVGPDYIEGLVNVVPGPFPAGFVLPYTCIVVEQSRVGAADLVSTPTSWWWNIRLGDRIRIGTSSRSYTVCGPMVQPNAEGFTNIGTNGMLSDLDRGLGPVEYLFLVDGQDDDGDGYIDSGFDGVDNNGDLLHLIDEPAEWEPERWDSTLATGISASPYRITRRPFPSSDAAVTLPSSAVIDLTTWSTTRERSRLPVDPTTGFVDLMVSPNGQVTPSLPYGVPTSLGLGAAFYHLWITDRSGVVDPVAAPAGQCRFRRPSIESNRPQPTLGPAPRK